MTSIPDDIMRYATRFEASLASERDQQTRVAAISQALLAERMKERAACAALAEELPLCELKSTSAGSLSPHKLTWSVAAKAQRDAIVRVLNNKGEER